MIHHLRRAAFPFTLLLTATALLTGCATSKKKTYRVEVGVRSEIHDETADVGLDQALTAMAGTPVVTTQGDPRRIYARGMGGQIGIVEELKYVVTRISVFGTQFDTINYAFLVPSTGARITQKLDVSLVGLDVALAFPVWILRPQLTYKYQSRVMKASMASTAIGVSSSTAPPTQTDFFVGGGLNLDLPVSKGFHLVGDCDYRVPISSGSGSIAEITFQAGIRFGNWETK